MEKNTSQEEAEKEAHRAVRWPRRLTRDQEMRIIMQLPKLQKAIMISKVAAVFLFAVGLEGIVTANWLMAVVFLGLGIAFALWPIRMNLPNVCPKCGAKVPHGSAICRECGIAVV